MQLKYILNIFCRGSVEFTNCDIPIPTCLHLFIFQLFWIFIHTATDFAFRRHLPMFFAPPLASSKLLPSVQHLCPHNLAARRLCRSQSGIEHHCIYHQPRSNSDQLRASEYGRLAICEQRQPEEMQHKQPANRLQAMQLVRDFRNVAGS